MSIAYVLGFICGLGLVFVLGLIVKKIFFKKKSVYDERQIAEQGKACKYGYYFMLGYAIFVGIVDNVVSISSLGIGMFPVMMVGVLISLVIYAGYCIWKEAYFPINQSSMKYIILLLVIGAFNVFVAVTNIGNDMNIMVTNTMCAVLVISIAVVSLIKLKRGNRELEDDDDDEIEYNKEEELQ